MDMEDKDIGNGVIKTKMEFLNDKFFYWAKIWDDKNTLHLNGLKNKKKQNNHEDEKINAVQIFGWKDGTS